MFFIGYLSLLKTFAEIDLERALSCPCRASYEAKWFDVALDFSFFSLRPISSANKSHFNIVL